MGLKRIISKTLIISVGSFMLLYSLSFIFSCYDKANTKKILVTTFELLEYDNLGINFDKQVFIRLNKNEGFFYYPGVFTSEGNTYYVDALPFSKDTSFVLDKSLFVFTNSKGIILDACDVYQLRKQKDNGVYTNIKGELVLIYKVFPDFILIKNSKGILKSTLEGGIQFGIKE